MYLSLFPPLLASWAPLELGKRRISCTSWPKTLHEWMQRSQGVTGKFIFTVWPDKSPGVFQCSLKSFSLDFSKGNRLPPTDPEGLLGSRILSFQMGKYHRTWLQQKSCMILNLASPFLVKVYLTCFPELWESRTLFLSGRNSSLFSLPTV